MADLAIAGWRDIQSGYAQYHDQIIKVRPLPVLQGCYAPVASFMTHGEALARRERLRNVGGFHALILLSAVSPLSSRRATGPPRFTSSSSCGASATPTTTAPTSVSPAPFSPPLLLQVWWILISCSNSSISGGHIRPGYFVMSPGGGGQQSSMFRNLLSRKLDCARKVVRREASDCMGSAGLSCGGRLVAWDLAAQLSNICIVLCALVEYEKQQQGGPEIIWPH